MAYNFDEYFRRFLQLFKQMLKSDGNHPLKNIFTEEDIDRLIANPPSQEDVMKFMQYFFNNPNFNQFSQNNPIFMNFASQFPKDPSPSKKPSSKVRPDENIITETFEFEDEVHVLIGTNRTDLDFKTGLNKDNPDDVALIIRDKKSIIVQIVKLPNSIDPKSKQVTYQNGTYEIVYKVKK